MLAQPQRVNLPANAKRRGLARTVKPIQDETLHSYLSRLAHANRVPLPSLLAYLVPTWTGAMAFARVPAVSAEALAAVSRQPRLSLLYALPELRTGSAGEGLRLGGRALAGEPNVRRLACRRCMAARGIDSPVWCWRRHDQNVCLRHQRWIGRGVRDLSDQLDVSSLPEVAHAQHRHGRLVRRFGRQDVLAGFSAAEAINAEWLERKDYMEVHRRRLIVLHGPDWTIPSLGASVHAVTYPEAVALAGLLSSPHWHRLGASPRPQDARRFNDEVRHRVIRAYRGAPAGDPLNRWRCQEAVAWELAQRRGQAEPPSSTLNETTRAGE